MRRVPSVFGLALTLAVCVQVVRGQRPELVTRSGHGPTLVTGIAFSPDGRTLASSCLDKSVRLWDVEQGGVLRTFHHTEGFWSVAFNSDGRLVAAGSQGLTKVWDVRSGTELHSFKVEGFIANAVAFSPDDKLLAVATSVEKSHSIELWSIETGARLKRLPGHPDYIRQLAFTEDGKYLLSGSSDKTIKIWDVASGENVQVLPDYLPGLYFSHDKTLAAGAKDDQIKIFEMAKDAERLTISVPRPGGLSNFINELAFSPNNKILASAEILGLIRLWDAATGKELRQLKGESFYFSRVALTPDGHTIALADLQGVIKLWDTRESKFLRNLLETSGVLGIEFGPGGRALATASTGNTLKVWDVTKKSGVVIPAVTQEFLEGGEMDAVGNLNALSQKWAFGAAAFTFGGGGKLILIGGRDKAVRLWDLSGERMLRAFPVNDEPDSVALSPDDGTVLAATGKSIKAWRVSDGRLLFNLRRDCRGAVGFGSDGKTVAGCVNAGTLNVWDARTGALLRSHPFESEAARSEARGLSPALYAKIYEPFSADKFTTVSSPGDSDRFRFLEKGTGKELATLTFYGLSDWLVTTPEGFFDGTPNAWSQLLWRFNNNTFDHAPVETYFNDFFYPNLLQDVLAGKAPQPKEGRELERIDRRQPRVEITSVNGLNRAQLGAGAATTQRTATVVVEVTDNAEPKRQLAHDMTSGAQDLRLFRNGSLVRVWDGDVFRLGKAKGCERVGGARRPARIRCRAEVSIVVGENNFTAYAFNASNVKSKDDRVTLNGAESLQRAGTLYVLAVGINLYADAGYNLNFAVPDVQDIGAALAAEQRKLAADPKLRQYERTVVVTLTDESATKESILLALRRFDVGEGAAIPASAAPETRAELSKIRLAQPEDALLIYYAGHGTSRGQRFYLLPHDFTGPDALVARGLSDIELNKALEGIDAGRLLMVIDACQSGQALGDANEGRAPMNSKGLAQLAYDKGMLILTATQSRQAALEATYVGTREIRHGLLTYALLEGLASREADHDGNRQLWEREWLGYAVEQVPLLQVEAMRQRRREIEQTGRGADLIYVEGDDQRANPDDRLVQTPRVFYRREPETSPLIVARP